MNNKVVKNTNKPSNSPNINYTIAMFREEDKEKMKIIHRSTYTLYELQEFSLFYPGNKQSGCLCSLMDMRTQCHDTVSVAFTEEDRKSVV